MGPITLSRRLKSPPFASLKDHVPSSVSGGILIRVTPSFRVRRILPKKHNHLKIHVNSLISSEFQVLDSPRVIPDAGLMKPCPQEHLRPIGSISPGAIAHDRRGSARRVTNSQLVCVSGGFQADQASGIGGAADADEPRDRGTRGPSWRCGAPRAPREVPWGQGLPLCPREPPHVQCLS